ncbi:unnamed protein product [Closterium sp. NIES-53]
MFITLYFIVTRLPDSLLSVRDHFLALDPTVLTVDLLEQHLLAAETSVVVVGAARGTPRTPFFEGCSPSPLAPSYASDAVADVLGAEDVGAASASGKRRNSKGKEFGDKPERPRWVELLRSGVAIFVLDYDVILATMYALFVSAEGDYYLCVPPDPGIKAAALGASESALPGTAPSEALHTFTLDSGASRCFFRDSTTLTPLSAPVPVRLADPSGGPNLAHSSTVLPCPAVPSGSLSSLHLPSFSTNLVSTAALQDAMVTTTTPGGQRVSICTCTRTGRHLATFTRRPGSSLYTLATEPPQVAASAQVSASGPVFASPPARACLPCLPSVKGRQRAAPHSSSFPPMTAPLQTLHMDVWGPARVSGQGRERYFMLDLLVLCLHSDRGGEFSSNLLRDFCRGEGILQSFTLSDSPQQNGIAERRIGLAMEGTRDFVHDTSADKLSTRAIPCVFLGFPPDAPGWKFYHPTSRSVFPSQDVTFDESVPFYRLFPYRSAPPPPLPLFLAPGAARGAVSGGAEPGGAEPAGAEPAGAEPAGVESGGAEPESVEPGGAESGGAEPRGTASSRGPAGALPRLSPQPEPLSPQQLREWFTQRTSLRSGAAGAGDSAALGSGVIAVAGGTGGAAAAGPGGARTRGTGAAGTGSVGGAVAGDPTEPGAAGAGGARAGGTGASGAEVGGAGAVGAGAGGTGAGCVGGGGAGAVDLGAGGAVSGGTVRPRPYFAPLIQQTGGLIERREPASRPTSPVRTGRRIPRPRPPPVPDTHDMALRPSSVPLRVPLPPPPESSLLSVPDPESDRARAANPTVSRLLATIVTDPSFESTAASDFVAELVDFAAACRLDYATTLVAESESASPPSVGGECALGTDVLEDRQEDFECLAAAVPRFASILLAPKGEPDSPDIPTPRSYAEAITCPYSSQWLAAMDAKMASLKSTSTYIDAVPPSWANIVDGMWIFRGVDYFQTFSPTPKMTTLWVLLHVAAQRDYELHSLDFSTAFLQGSLHEEISLCRPPGFTGTTLVALGFTPSTADPSLFLRTDTSLPPFYVLVYVNDLVFATTDTKALILLNSELQKRHTCTDLGELRRYLGLQITRDRARRTITLTQSHMVHQVLQRFGFQFSSPQPTPVLVSTGHSLLAPPSDESVEPSGLYPKLVGCLMYLMTCTRPDLAYPLNLLARYVAPAPAVRLRSTQGPWLHKELCWLTYLLTDSGEQPRSPPVLTKHIALRYFLARELQQRGQLRVAYVATRANTTDIFTKALPSGDH